MAKKQKRIPRGVLNNNPGNIRINSDKFIGEIIPSRDGEFKQFDTMAHGYRAIFKILSNYYYKYSLKTIRQMITRWAPPKENHTDKYIKFVANAAGISADETVNIKDMRLMIKLVGGMSKMENGIEPDLREIEDGWYMLYTE